MARGRDWNRDRDRQRVRKQGADPIGVVPLPARKKGKAALSVAMEAAGAEVVTKILRCPCGHRGRIELPASMLAGKRFRCTTCGRRVS